MELLKWLREGKFRGVFIDSRKPLEGGLFICIRGDKFDGNSFALSALDAGAKAALVERQYYEENPGKFEGRSIAVVEDGEQALRVLAGACREEIGPKVIGIVGSGGKTTTKNMLASILRLAHKTHATKGNLNNQIGLPLTLLNMPETTEYLVLEMGVSREGAMERLADIARPDVVLMTNIGTSHIEYFHTRENILQEKLQANAYAKPDHLLVQNGFDPLFAALPEPEYRRILTDPEQLEILGSEEGFYHFTYKGMPIRLGVRGAYQVRNALLCIEAALAMGIAPQQIQKGLESYRGEPQRFMVSKKDGVTYIDDVYNSSPDSIAAALETQLMLEGKRHIAVLGDVLELGERAEREHQRIGTFEDLQALDAVFTIGDYAAHISKAHPRGEHFRDVSALISRLREEIREGDVVLVKASRGMQLERVLKGIGAVND